MQNKYDIKDSAIAFILALVIPNVLAFIVLIFASCYTDINTIETTRFYKVLATTLNQISFLLVFFLIIKKKKISIKNSVQTKKLNFKQILILVSISFVCLFLISPIINVFDNLLVKVGVSSSNLPINLTKPINFVYLILTMGILAPVAEEFVFRGIILDGLKSKGNRIAIIVSSLMFMLIHLSLHQTIYQFILGIILAIVVLITDNIFSSILIHFINNTFVLIINYINPHLFEYNYLSFWYILIAIILFILAIVVLIFLIKKLKTISLNNIIQEKNCLQENVKQEKLTNCEANMVDIEQAKQNNYLKFGLLFGIFVWIITVILSL